MDQLVLGQKSYIRQFFAKSPWYDEFLRDMRFCEACFFVGYSLADPHVTALIVDPERSKTRTYFILRAPQDDLLLEHIQDYGEAHTIETTGFAKICRSLVAPAPVTDLNKLRALRFIDPLRDQKVVVPPTPLEIINLVTFGAFDGQRVLSTMPGGTYVIPRERAAGQAVQAVQANKTTLVHARLGNGKTIFLWILAHHLTALGYRCFRCDAVTPAIEREAKALEDIAKVVIFFDSYDVGVESIDRLNELLPKARFVVSVRTGVQEVRLHEIVGRLPAPIARVNLNLFSGEDQSDFIDLLIPVGALRVDLENRIRNCSDVREVVTSIYENRGIQERIRESLKSLLADAAAKSVAILGLLLSWISQAGDPSFYLEAIDVDPYTTLAKHREVAVDIFNLDDDQVQARSPIFSEYLLQRQFLVDEVLHIVERALIAAVQRKRERKYRVILGSLMRYSQLIRIVRHAPEMSDKVIALYGRLQRDVGIQEEPLFWLQYSIAMTEGGDPRVAEGFLQTAYKKAEASGDFATYQLDTYALRLYLLLEATSGRGKAVERFDEILSATKIVSQMIGEEAHRAYAVKVIEGWLPFVQSRVSDLSTGERNRCLASLDDVLDKLSRLTPSARAETGSDLIKADLETAKKVLLLGSA